MSEALQVGLREPVQAQPLHHLCQGFGLIMVIPREQKMLTGHLPRVIYHQVYQYTKTHIRQSRPDAGLGFQAKVHKPLKLFRLRSESSEALEVGLRQPVQAPSSMSRFTVC